jgi:ACT domain-containing protein
MLLTKKLVFSKKNESGELKIFSFGNDRQTYIVLYKYKDFINPVRADGFYEQYCPDSIDCNLFSLNLQKIIFNRIYFDMESV